MKKLFALLALAAMSLSHPASAAYEVTPAELVAIAKIMAKADDIAKADGGKVYSVVAQNIVLLRAKYAGRERQQTILDVISKQVASRLAKLSGTGSSVAVAKPAAPVVVQQTQEQIKKVNEVVGSGATIATPIGVAAAQQTAQKLKDAGLTDLEASIYTSRYGAQAEYDFVACAPFTRDIYPTLFCVNGDSGIDACTSDEAVVSNKQEGALNPWPAAGSTAAQKEQYRANSNGLARVQYCAGNFHILEKRFSANITQDTMATLFAKLGRSYVKQTKPVWELGVKLQEIPSWADGLGNGKPIN